MTWNRRLSAVGLALALMLQMSCAVTDTTSSDSLTPGVNPAAQSAKPSFDYRAVEVSDLLSCKPQPYIASTKLVGPKGARIKVGSHVLLIPEGALDRNVSITAEQITGPTNSVRFSPEGLTFAVPAELTMSYENCTEVMLPKRIAYTTELLKVLELLPSRDKAQSRSVTSPLDHFSRYAVAY
jgi:hypothetical protein